MRIPIRDQTTGNIIRWENIDNPQIVPPTDFNRIPERISETKGRTESNPRMEKDVNLGVNRVVPSNEAYFKGKKPQNVL